MHALLGFAFDLSQLVRELFDGLKNFSEFRARLGSGGSVSRMIREFFVQAALLPVKVRNLFR